MSPSAAGARRPRSSRRRPLDRRGYRLRASAVAEIRENDLLEIDLVQLPPRVVDVPVRAHEEARLAVGVTLADHRVDACDLLRVAACAGEEPMARQDVVDRPHELCAS